MDEITAVSIIAIIIIIIFYNSGLSAFQNPPIPSRYTVFCFQIIFISVDMCFVFSHHIVQSSNSNSSLFPPCVVTSPPVCDNDHGQAERRRKI